MKTKKKKKVYHCKWHEQVYDDLGKYSYCNSSKINCIECKFKYVYAEQACPGFEKGILAGKWEISPSEKKELEDFKKQHKKELQDQEIAERALYEYLKQKYE